MKTSCENQRSLRAITPAHPPQQQATPIPATGRAHLDAESCDDGDDVRQAAVLSTEGEHLCVSRSDGELRHCPPEWSDGRGGGGSGGLRPPRVGPSVLQPRGGRRQGSQLQEQLLGSREGRGRRRGREGKVGHPVDVQSLEEEEEEWGREKLEA